MNIDRERHWLVWDIFIGFLSAFALVLVGAESGVNENSET